VGGVLEIPVEAATAAEARRIVCKEVAAGVRQQPGGPTLFFGEGFRLHFIAVMAGTETPQRWPHLGGSTS
jgi:hypothetical protein